MPSISPARLNKEVSALFANTEDVESFKRGLTHLLESYADGTVRPTRSGQPTSLLPAYHVPKPVLRHLETGLSHYALKNPIGALDIADTFWDFPYLENKMLAIGILEALPAEESAEALERLKRWIAETKDEDLLGELFRVGVALDEPEMLDLVEGLMDSSGGSDFGAALAALQAISQNTSPDSLPGIFRLLRSAIDIPGADRSAKLLTMTRRLAKQSPDETAYFLRQQYLVTLRPELGRLLRRSMDYFPETVQEDLRRMLRENPVQGQ